MGVLGHSSLSGGPRPGGKGWLVFLLGALLGAGGGFWAGRWYWPLQSRPAPVPPPAEVVQAERQPLQPVPPPPAPPPSAPADDVRRLEVTLGSSLNRTLAGLMDQREADVLSAHLGRLLIWWLDLRRDVLEGDRLQVLYRPHPDPEKLRVLALRYYSEKLGRELTAFYFKATDAAYGRYYDADGVEVELRLQASPLEEYEQVTERMNLSGRRHRGVDFKADVGTPVRSPYRARVLRRNWQSRLNGNCLQLQYLESGRYALFLHLDQVEASLKPGTVVEAGQEVGRSGNTGRSTAPHLHYELHAADGRLLDPFLAEPTVRRRLSEDALQEYQRLKSELLGRLSGSTSAGATTPAPVPPTPGMAPPE